MAFAFDTLGYTKHLEDAGVPRGQAEAHATAAREFIMAELVTKADLASATDGVRSEIALTTGALRNEMDALRAEMGGLGTSLRLEIDNAVMRLTIRMGGALIVGFGAMTAILGYLTAIK
jgi:hypothetical protein